MVGAAVFELATSVAAFWSETGQVYQERNPRTTDDTGGRTKEALKAKSLAMCYLLLGYVGAEGKLPIQSHRLKSIRLTSYERLLILGQSRLADGL
jgi:hypothetical protein